MEESFQLTTRFNDEANAILKNPGIRLRTEEYAKAALHRVQDLSEINWSAKREVAKKAVAAAAHTTPIDQGYLSAELISVLPKNVILVDETLTASAGIAIMFPADDRRSFYSLASGGLGFGMPGAVGVSMAQPDRPVVATIGDGSAMYGIQALWTAAHFKLPITYVIINNRSYRIIKERLLAMRGTDQFTAMDMNDPPIDFVAVAKGLGMTAQRVTDPTQLSAVLKLAVESGRPNLVEVIVANGFGD
jgi:benzoylformate decarboxylase